MKISDSWSQYLTKIQEKFPGAVIAGGCLRDLKLGFPIKDIDIFIPNGDDSKFREYVQIDQNEIITKESINYGGMSNEDVQYVFSTSVKIKSLETDLVGIPVEFIFVNLKEGEKIKDRFDFGICHIEYNGAEILFDKHFLLDEMFKTVTLVRCDNEAQYGRSLRRWNENFQFKFKDWKLVIPDSFASFNTIITIN